MRIAMAELQSVGALLAVRANSSNNNTSNTATTTTTTTITTITIIVIIAIIREGIPQNENVCGKIVLNLSFLFSFALLWGGFRHIDSGTIDK